LIYKGDISMIDNSIVEQARTADVLAFFEKYHGFTFAPMSGGYRCRQHKSLAVKADRLSWYWHSRGVGGFGALDYLVKAENMAFREAVEVVTGISPVAATPRLETPPPKSLVLPDKTGLSLRLYDYLCMKRGIDGEVVNTLIQRKMLYEDKRGNVVFVGRDELGAARFASVRGTYGDCAFRGDCSGSDKRYGFAVAACAPSDRLYIFESPIDLMSHASLVNADIGDTGAWKRDSRLSLSGTADTALDFLLNKQNAFKVLVFCLDNDRAGREAAVQLARKYAFRGYTALNEPPRGKDFNEDLQAYRAAIQADKRHTRKDLII
jgi:hypothetical protein